MMIGEFASLAGVSAKMLRHYDEIGLFQPAYHDPRTGYRYYSPAQLPELHRLVALRDLGLPLAEIVAVAGDPVGLERALATQRRRLEEARELIRRRLAAASIHLHVDRHGDPISVVTRRARAQLYAQLSVRIRPDDDLEPAFDRVEAFVRDREARAALPPISIDHRLRHGVRVVDILVPVTHGIEPCDDERGAITNRRLDACFVATVIHRGGYGDLADTDRVLTRWLRETRTAATGLRRTVYLQFGADAALRLPGAFVVGHSRRFVTELQQPLA